MIQLLRRLVLMGACVSGISVQGALFSDSFASGTLNHTIADGDFNGYANVINVADMDTSLVSVSVGLQISGGWNGDLYAFLSYGDQMVILLNRVGRGSDSSMPYGYNDGGLNITLGISGPDIHDYRSVGVGYAQAIQNPSAPWSADGRNVDPTSVAFGSTPRTSLADFRGVNPNGSWTLFFADVSGGGVSRLDHWSLNIEAVPEPVTVSLVIVGGVFVCIQAIRSLRFSSRTG